jgi:hypothetical protein
VGDWRTFPDVLEHVVQPLGTMPNFEDESHKVGIEAKWWRHIYGPIRTVSYSTITQTRRIQPLLLLPEIVFQCQITTPTRRVRRMRAANKRPSRRLASFLRRRLGALTKRLLVPHGNSLDQAQAVHELQLWMLCAGLQRSCRSEHLVNFQQQNPPGDLIIVRSRQLVNSRLRSLRRKNPL